MLKFLTHKLRTHSLNEESVSEKVEERDSGTESDDEADRADTGDIYTDVIMKWNDVTDLDGEAAGAGCACAPTASTPRLLPPPEPDLLYDHHSSEEELEVETPVRFRTSPPLEALKPRRSIGLSALGALNSLSNVSTDSTSPGIPGPVGLSTANAGSTSCACARPDRRRKVALPPRRHRPALDFDKMQQLKVGGGPRSWRAVGGAHTGELSVFCW